MNNLKLTGRKPGEANSVIEVGGVRIGEEFVVIAGPCSVETEEQTIRTAVAVKEAGAKMLRGGAFKPRTSPYAFQGLGLKGLKILDRAKRETGLPIVTEVVDTRDVSWVGEYADVLQIGARNMQNFSLLREAGKSGKVILLKRGMYSTLEEWLNCAEYILAEGNDKVILCERGIRTFETYTRNTLDLSMVPAVHAESHLPIIVDPSHGTGILYMIAPMSLSAVAAGADGLEIEVHVDPKSAMSDKDQQLTPEAFAALMRRIAALREFMSESAMADAYAASRGDPPTASQGSKSAAPSEGSAATGGASRDPSAREGLLQSARDPSAREGLLKSARDPFADAMD
jgi:3-deoxy-7-phosphoheptulonate synthase